MVGFGWVLWIINHCRLMPNSIYTYTLNKFTYLDYVFLLSSYCQILIHIYFHNVLSEKQTPNTFLHDIKHGWLQNVVYTWKVTCLCVFLNKREDLSRFFGKCGIFKCVSTCQTRSFDFWIMNTVHVCVSFCYIFPFVPVITVSIHRHMNYSDIQVLVMVTNTETFNVDFTS